MVSFLRFFPTSKLVAEIIGKKRVIGLVSCSKIFFLKEEIQDSGEFTPHSEETIIFCQIIMFIIFTGKDLRICIKKYFLAHAIIFTCQISFFTCLVSVVKMIYLATLGVMNLRK